MGHYSVIIMVNGLYLRPNDVLFNTRTKYRKDPQTGDLIPYECMYSSKRIFNPDHAELSETSKTGYGLSTYEPDPVGDLLRSQRRAKGKVFDLIVCNEFDCFATLTLNGDLIDRRDYDVIMKKLNNYLDNRVRRKGLYYLGVPELHKRGGFHFHFLCNAAALNLIDSGTVSCAGHKRPIKVSTANRLHIPMQDRRIVYNVADWKIGFSTAIMTYGSPLAVGNYIGKYITKGEKVGGRWYYSGGDLERPILRYDNIDFDDVTDYTYAFDVEGIGQYKILRYDDKGAPIYGG